MSITAAPKSSSSPWGFVLASSFSPFAAKRLKSALFSWDNLLPLLAALVYLTNRFVLPLDSVLPYDFANYYLGDLCGGVVFPAYVNFLTRTVSRREAITNLKTTLLLSLLCSFCWEFVTSCVFRIGTADPVDALMYLLGGLLFLASHSVLQRMGATPACPEGHTSCTVVSSAAVADRAPGEPPRS